MQNEKKDNRNFPKPSNFKIKGRNNRKTAHIYVSIHTF